MRSTARVTRDGEEAEDTETAPISKVMKCSGLVASEEAPATETEQVDVEETESKDDYSAAASKPSHLDFGKSTILRRAITHAPGQEMGIQGHGEVAYIERGL